MREPVLLSWSGGKDSALALHALSRSADLQPAGLLTTVTDGYDRISIHGVRRALLRRQAEAVGLPLHEAVIPKECSNAKYEECLAAALRPLRDAGIRRVAWSLWAHDPFRFGDSSTAS